MSPSGAPCRWDLVGWTWNPGSTWAWGSSTTRIRSPVALSPPASFEARGYTTTSFRAGAGSKRCPGIHWVTYPVTADAATE